MIHIIIFLISAITIAGLIFAVGYAMGYASYKKDISELYWLELKRRKKAVERACKKLEYFGENPDDIYKISAYEWETIVYDENED